jgi:DNA-binding NtrC family response regulator
LRDLGSDKLVLLNYFRGFYAQQIKQEPFELLPDALQYWEQYSFPGNTRELRNIVIRLATKYPGKSVDKTQLQDEFDPMEISADLQLKEGNFSLDQHLHQQEGSYIASALELASGNISEAAKLLGINRTTLHSRMSTHQKNNS